MRCVQCDCELSEDSVLLTFDSGRSWLVAERALHYYACHRWAPPADFLDDVMTRRMIPYDANVHRDTPTQVGFISENEPYFQADPVTGFFTRFWSLINLASRMNQKMVLKRYNSRKAMMMRGIRNARDYVTAGFAKAGTVLTLGALLPRD